VPASTSHSGLRTRLVSAVAAAAVTATGLILATASPAGAETGCKSGSITSGPGHGWHLQICKTPHDPTADTFSWTARNTDSGAAAATVIYSVACDVVHTGDTSVSPPGPVTWAGSYASTCSFRVELTAAGAVPIVLTLAAG
jgi:hypothetical protein